MTQFKFDLSQFWPALVAVYEAVVTALTLFGVWENPDPDQLAFIMGLPAVFAGVLAPRTHASRAVLDELAEAD